MDKKLKNYIIFVLRKGTLRWKPRSEAMKKARRELPRKINKDGSKSKKKEYEYQCAICLEWFRSKEINLDHTEPICPIGSSYDELSLDTIVTRMYTTVDKFQVLCIIDHKIKSSLESTLRAEYKEKKTEKENTIECMNMLKEFNKKGKKK